MRAFAPVAATLALVLSACAGGPVGNADVPEPARAVELNRYLGLWYEHARYENRFEEGCEAVTAQYDLRPDGLVGVRNTCRQDGVDGPIKVSEGRAKLAGDPMGAKLKVSFFGPPLMTNYWVLDHGEAYDWAIVGEGSGRFLWILTREAVPAEPQRVALLNRARELGYDVDMIRFTQHAPPR